MKLEPESQHALERLAKQNRGRQGVGFISSAKIAMRLFQVGLARPVKDHQERNLCAVTIDGFRFLEAERTRKETASA